MKVLIISDTHRRLANLEKLLTQVQPIDMLLHCGDAENDEERIERMVDCPVYIVAGNCDYNGINPFDRCIDIEGHRVLITHGHKYSVGFNLNYISAIARNNKAEAAFYGHLHRPHMEENGGVIIASPGSLSEPRQEGGKPSYIIMNAERNKELQIEIKYFE